MSMSAKPEEKSIGYVYRMTDTIHWGRKKLFPWFLALCGTWSAAWNSVFLGSTKHSLRCFCALMRCPDLVCVMRRHLDTRHPRRSFSIAEDTVKEHQKCYIHNRFPFKLIFTFHGSPSPDVQCGESKFIWILAYFMLSLWKRISTSRWSLIRSMVVHDTIRHRRSPLHTVLHKNTKQPFLLDQLSSTQRTPLAWVLRLVLFPKEMHELTQR